MRLKLSTLSLVLTALLAGAALAQVPGQLATPESAPAEEPSEMPGFEVLDQNSDGDITTEEARDSWLASVFYQIDVDRDGLITRSEYQQATT